MEWMQIKIRLFYNPVKIPYKLFYENKHIQTFINNSSNVWDDSYKDLIKTTHRLTTFITRTLINQHKLIPYTSLLSTALKISPFEKRYSFTFLCFVYFPFAPFIQEVVCITNIFSINFTFSYTNTVHRFCWSFALTIVISIEVYKT